MSTGEREMEAGSAWRPWPRFRITKGPKSGISGRRGRWTRALGVFFVDHVRLGQGGKPVPRISLSRAALGRLQEVDNSRFPWHQLAGYNRYNSITTIAMVAAEGGFSSKVGDIWSETAVTSNVVRQADMPSSWLALRRFITSVP